MNIGAAYGPRLTTVGDGGRTHLERSPEKPGQFTKGSGTRLACLTMVFKLTVAAQKGWRTLNGAKLLADVIEGVVFEDGVRKQAA